MQITFRAAGLAVAVALAMPVAAEELFIPMVAQKQGQDGAWWNTEIWITNTTATTGGYGAVFLPAGQPNGEGLRADVEMEDILPGATVYRKDLVPQGSVGVLRVVATAGIQVYARVFNAAGRGSFGEGIAGMPRSAAVRPGEIAHLIGLRRTPQFRTNLFFFNPTQDDGVVRIRLMAASGEVVREQSYRMAPGGFLQLDDALHALAVTRGEHLRAEVTGTAPFFAFASVVDTRSGAPTLVQPLR
jgi:hypothetical protein